jgi:hypothetical protein
MTGAALGRISCREPPIMAENSRATAVFPRRWGQFARANDPKKSSTAAAEIRMIRTN